MIVVSKLIVATDFARNTVNSDRANKGAVTLKLGICFQQTNRSELLSAHSSRLSGNKSLCQRLPPRRRIRSNAKCPGRSLHGLKTKGKLRKNHLESAFKWGKSITHYRER